MGGRPAQPHRLRRRAPRRIAVLRAVGQLRRLPRLAAPLGRRPHPDRRHSRPDPRRPPRTGPHRRRPTRRRRHRRPHPRRPHGRSPQLPGHRLRRPGDGTLRRPGPRAGHPPQRRTRQVRHTRVPAHPAARTARPGSTRSQPTRCGCTADPVTAPPSRPRCSTTAPAASSTSTTTTSTPNNSASVSPASNGAATS